MMLTNKATQILRRDVADVIVTRHCNGENYSYHVGACVGVTSYDANGVQSYAYATIVSLGRGTEANMLGDNTALAVVVIAGVGERTIPLRLLDVYEGAGS